MAITTLDQALAGMQPSVWFEKAITPTLVSGRPQSLWYLSGNPGAGSGAATTAGGVVQTNPVAGGIPFTNPGSGNTYLSMLRSCSATAAGTLLLIDRLLCVAGNSGGAAISIAGGAQTINSLQIPARDNTGTNAGVGVLAGMEIITATGAGTPTVTVTYTNQSGVGSRTAGFTFAVVANGAIGAFYPFALQAGDQGMQSIQGFNLSGTMTTGSIQLVFYRILAAMEVAVNYIPGAPFNLASGGFPQIFNDSVLSLLFIPNATTASVVRGMAGWTQG